MSEVIESKLITGIKSSRGQRLRPKLFLKLAPIFLGASFLFHLHTAQAKPRDPLPPFPEFAPVLYHETFDEGYCYGMTNAQIMLNGYTFDESWSGYALRRAGAVVPFVVPAVDSTGRTNMASASGTIRFWFKPEWTTGTGPGAIAMLAEIGVASGRQSVGVWSLQVSADGSALSLVAQSDSGPVQLLSTQINWQSGEWHLITLDYDPTGTAVFLDAQWAAQTTSTIAIPSSVGVLALGSALAGNASSGGDIDELCTFATPLDQMDLAFYYNGNSRQAALGPVTQAELDAQEAEFAIAAFSRFATPMGNGPLGPLDSGGGCVTGGPVYLTNLFVTEIASNGCTVTMNVAGGTNGIPYCLYMATNLVADLTNAAWGWVQYVYACDTITLSNQSLTSSFYIIGPEKDTDGDGIPDSWEILHGLNPLDPSDANLDPDDDGLTNYQEYLAGGNPFDSMLFAWGDNNSGQSAVPWGFPGVTAMAGGGGSGSGGFTLVVTNQGRIAAWGADNYGQIDVPAGLSNVVAVTAGGDQSAALKADGTVVQWGRQFDSVPGSATNVTAISAGYQHFLALRADGTVITWGRSNCPANYVPSGLNGVKAIGAGWNHNVALLSNGTVTAWGLNAASLNWNLTNIPSGLTDIAAISVGALHSVALRSNGTVVAWGYNQGGETNVPPDLANVVAIAAGRGYTLALCQDQSIVAWGAGLAGVPSGLTASAIAAGPGHALALRMGILIPLILEQPRSQGVPAGETATFHVRASSRRQPSYQWQWNDSDIAGATNDTLTISNVQDASQGHYRVRVTNGAGTVYSDEAELVLVLAPVIISPVVPQTVLAESGGSLTLTVSATAQGSQYSGLNYSWFKDGQPATMALPTPTLSLGVLSPLQSGQYWAVVSNVVGSATSAVWTVHVQVPGGVGAWGTNAPVPPDQLTNAIALAGGGGHALAMNENGTLFAWGANDFGQTNVPADLSNVVAVAAGAAHSLALRGDGSVVAWGRNDLGQTNIPLNVSDAIAISAGGQQSLALKRDGTVVQWGQTFAAVPSGLVNVTAIASGTNFHLALLSNATVAAWGANDAGQTSVPSNLSNVVAIAAAGAHALALKSDGTVSGWGSDGSGESDPPSDLTNAMTIVAGTAHSVALRNDGTITAWGDNTYGQTNVTIGSGAVKLIAAGNGFTMASQFSPLLQYAVDVTKDMLLIYNSNSTNSTTLKDYYLAHRPMVSNANVLGISCATNEVISATNCDAQIVGPVLAWLASNPTKHPGYIVLFYDMPTRIQNPDPVDYPSVTLRLYNSYPGTSPFITYINAGTLLDCEAYIDKVAHIGTNYSPGKLIISAGTGGYGNSNYYFDNTSYMDITPNVSGLNASNSVVQAGALAQSVTYTNVTDSGLASHITAGINVAGYMSFGLHSSLGGDYPINGTVQWSGNSGWWIIETVESFNGIRNSDHGNFMKWLSSNAFGGAGYSNTPVGAVCHVEEPYEINVNDASIYFGLWTSGKNFAICAWNSRYTPYFQAVGDPLVTK
jgi:alpha-tubulin suppressor-like RCC1 family protein